MSAIMYNNRFIKQILTKKNIKYLCNAAFVSMSIGIKGVVTPCCYTRSTPVNMLRSNKVIGNKTLFEIWNGDDFAYYRNSFIKNAFPKECIICKEKISSGNKEGAMSRQYDQFYTKSNYPQLIELTFDNTCNLECIMCNSFNSSKIAKKRGVISSDNFDKNKLIEEILTFLPSLKEIIISGGEPFLSKFSLDLMKQIVIKKPSCLISINTNGTILTNDIKLLMNAGNFHINLSLDSINKDTYEKIRIGADFDIVIKNLEFFSDYSHRKNIPLSIPVCPLVLNYEEIPQIVEFCNKQNYFIVFVQMFNAHDFALSSSDPLTIKKAIKIFESYNFPENNNVSKHNAVQFRCLLNDLKLWLDFAEQKKSFIDNLLPDMNVFLSASQILESRIKIFMSSAMLEKESFNRFEIWKNKKDMLFSVLPSYFYNKKFFEPLFCLPDEQIVFSIENLPIIDLRNFIITLGNDLLKKMFK